VEGDAVMIVAGIGCRRACPAARIVALVTRAAAAAGVRIDALAAPIFKDDEPGLREAALALGLPLHFVAAEAMTGAQDRCVTRSEAALRATGYASVAEGAALAIAGLPLLLPRIGEGEATCAIAGATETQT